VENGGTCLTSLPPEAQAAVGWQHLISLVFGSAELVNFGADHRLTLRHSRPQVHRDFFAIFWPIFSTHSI